MAESPNWRCYPDIETGKLKEEVATAGTYFTVEPGGMIYLLRGSDRYLSNYHNLSIFMGGDPIDRATFNYRNFRQLPQQLSYGPADLPLNGLTWQGRVKWGEEDSGIKNLYLNEVGLVTTEPHHLQPPTNTTVHIEQTEWFERFRQQFLDSIDVSTELIYKGLKIIELAYRGERTDSVGGYHFSDRELNGNDRVAAYYSDTLTIALLRLADFRTINPFLTP